MAGIDKVRFYKSVLPGDRFDISAKIDRVAMGIASASVTGWVNDEIVSECKITYKVLVGEKNLSITSTNQPDHKSMYYAPSNPLYEEYSEPDNEDFYKNPNTIAAMNYTFTIPRFPEAAINSEATPFGPMGVSINSVVFYNQNARPGDDILEELNTFDQYEGHPTNTGSYHYHIEPTWLTETKGDSTFLGLLLDGFPVYGPEENGSIII